MDQLDSFRLTKRFQRNSHWLKVEQPSVRQLCFAHSIRAHDQEPTRAGLKSLSNLEDLISVFKDAVNKENGCLQHPAQALRREVRPDTFVSIQPKRGHPKATHFKCQTLQGRALATSGLR